MAERKTLLKRYRIPLDHLDFNYVNECKDAREVERIVHVLQSGQEGFFPELTKCAEEKLRVLKPNSRLFRCEEPVRRSEDVNSSEVQPIYEFSRNVRERDQRLAKCAEIDDDLPPPRSSGSISINGKEETNEEESNNAHCVEAETKENIDKTGRRISSTDYRKWDQYDPEEEILRMDLEAERVQEEVERKNRINATKLEKTPLITEIKEEEDRIKKLTEVERENLAEEYRLRGNEYYRTKEYNSALAEYSRAIMINPSKESAAYNNRAMTYIKLKKYNEAIRDCEKCLEIEPGNIKALYRLAESSMHCGCKERALELFQKVLEIEPGNVNAKSFIEYLRPQIPESPPPNATRLLIQDESSKTNIQKLNTENSLNQKCDVKIIKEANTPKVVDSKSQILSTVKGPKDYDLASLVRPKEIIPNKWNEAAANMFGKHNATVADNNPSGGILTNNNHSKKEDEEVRLPIFSGNESTRTGKPLIEEL